MSSAFSVYSPHLCCSTCLHLCCSTCLHLCCSTCLHLHRIPSSVVSCLCQFVLCSSLCIPPLFLLFLLSCTLFFLVGTLFFGVCSSWLIKLVVSFQSCLSPTCFCVCVHIISQIVTTIPIIRLKISKAHCY